MDRIFYVHSLYSDVIERIRAIKPSILVLDDSLFDHYYYIDILVKLCKTVILAISPGLLYSKDCLRSRFIDTSIHLPFKTYYDYEKDYYIHKKQDVFMSERELDYCLSYSNVRIAFHSFNHKFIIDPLNGFKHPVYDMYLNANFLYNSYYFTPGFIIEDNKLQPRPFSTYLKDLEADFDMGFSWFRKRNISVSMYIPPYNKMSIFQLYMCRCFGISEVHSNDRISLDTFV